MSWGAVAFVGIFAFAAVCAAWNWRQRGAMRRRLLALGFEACPSPASALERAWRAVTRANPGDEVRVTGGLRRAAGSRTLHRFDVTQQNQGTDRDPASPGARFPAYLVDLREADATARGAVTLYLLPTGGRVARALIQRVIELAEHGTKLELTRHPGADSILAAYGEQGGKLDDVMPAAVQERLARAASHGFLCVHLAAGKAGFAALPNHLDVDAQLAYLAEWC